MNSKRKNKSALAFLLLLSILLGLGWFYAQKYGLIKGLDLSALWSFLSQTSTGRTGSPLEQALNQALGGLGPGMTDKALDAVLPTLPGGTKPSQGAPAAGAEHRVAAGSPPASGEELRTATSSGNLGSQNRTSAQGAQGREGVAPPTRIEAPSLAYVTDTFENFIKKLHSNARPAPNSRTGGGANYGHTESQLMQGSGEVTILDNSDFKADSKLQASPTYNQLKQAQKNVMDAVYMKANEADGQKARAGVWSDGNTILYDKIPIEQTDDSFRTRKIHPIVPAPQNSQ